MKQEIKIGDMWKELDDKYQSGLHLVVDIKSTSVWCLSTYVNEQEGLVLDIRKQVFYREDLWVKIR